MICTSKNGTCRSLWWMMAGETAGRSASATDGKFEKLTRRDKQKGRTAGSRLGRHHMWWCTDHDSERLLGLGFHTNIILAYMRAIRLT